MQKKTEKNCPCCENHCDAEALKCRRGAEYFGAERREASEERRERAPREREERTPEDKAIGMILKCGHYLHHRPEGGFAADHKALTACLSDEEKQKLTEILEKCLNFWTKQ